jgi:hypothetical protein
MNNRQKNVLLLFFIGITFIFLASACDKQDEVDSHALGTYPIAVIFEDFYEKLGGEEILGPAISSVFSRGDVRYQYTVNALMVYDPGASYSQRYQLAPIAKEWGIEEPPELQPGDPDVPYINGHQVWEEIRPFYKDFGGFLIGSPLTGVQYNEEKGRYEQYFTNLGFYRNSLDSPGKVHLMPYGDWFCASKCEYEIQDAVLVSPSDDLMASDIDRVFLEYARRLGNDFTGPAISVTLLASDGNYEKAFKNVVLYVSPDDQNFVYLRPLSQLVGTLPDPPVPPSDVPGMYFYEVQDELGYNVPQYFLDYIAMHGSMELSGPPITELHPTSDGVSSQCFTNYCLEYNATAPEAMRVQPASLGNKYIEQVPSTQPKVTEPAGAIGLQAWERYPLLPSGQSQEIGMAIDEDGVPLAGIEFSLTVTLPDGTQRNYFLSPTDADGQTTVSLDPIEAPNGSSILYQACVVSVLDRPVCIPGMFLIWDNP